MHIPDVYEKIVMEAPLISIDHRQWTTLFNPVDESKRALNLLILISSDGTPQYGTKKLIRGEANFFLQPGESINSVQNIYVLGEEEALYVTCVEPFEESLSNNKKVKRVPGERWLIYGPTEYIPPVEVQIIEKRKAWLQLESLNLYRFYWVKSYA